MLRTPLYKGRRHIAQGIGKVRYTGSPNVLIEHNKFVLSFIPSSRRSAYQNLDSTLEDMLLQVDLQPAAFQTLIVGQHKDESIANALEGSRSGIRIIKLHGSLRESVLPKQFPDFFELPVAIRENLSESLNQDIVIVGSIKRDKDIMRLLNASKRNHIYYAIPRKSSCDDVIKLIAARGNIPRSSLISGPSGEFATFFKLLEAKLLPSRSLEPLQTSLSNRRY